ncbi:MAG: glycosyltransferase family 39 protein, partial [Candidatus Curtissbacteria bacterium]|nr:glycosyltransferase family 39 protein [Candidatus Curtissbacteria bacterium]
MKTISKLSNLSFLAIGLILIIAFGVRLYKIDRPIADWHSWRQADTASVARNFVKEGFNPFVPTYDDMSTQANGLDNPNRYRFVEFPIFNSAVAAVWTIWGVNEMYARLTTVVITVFSTLLLYLVVRRFSGEKIALLAAFLFATLPYNVFYSSTILPAPLMVMGLLALYWSFINWMKTEKIIWAVASVIFANIAILTWPIALFFMLPIIYLAFNKYGLSAFTKVSLWIFALLSIAPFIAWRVWMMRFPEGIPNFRFLINENGIRFKGAFFRWIIVERLGKLILTVGGFTFLVIGVIKKPGREKLFYYAWLLSSVLYVTVFASGNVRHDYYQVPLIPIFCIFMAIGIQTLLTLPSQYFNRAIGATIALVLLLTIYAFGFFEVRGFYWINKPEIVEAGRAVDRLLPKDATVIAPYNGDAAFLYQTNRHGYPITDRPLEKFIERGTKYLVSVDPNDAGIKNLAEDCKTIAKTETYVIV